MVNASFQLRTIGHLLKERRRERKLSLSQISEITKIRSEYLKALEEGNFDVFPSEVYLKGFLKNYAKFLSVNIERALAMYRRERDYKNKEPVISMSQKIIDRNLNLTITPGRIIALVLIGALLLTVVYIGSYIGRIFKEPTLTVSTPIALEAGGEETIKTEDDSILIEGEVEVGAVLTINGQELQTNNFERFAEKFELQNGLNKFLLIAESQFGRESELTLNIFREPEASADVAGENGSDTDPTSIPDVVRVMKGSVDISDREAYIEITINGELVEAQTFQPGESFEFDSAAILIVFTPRPDTTKVTINGKVVQLRSTTTRWEIINGKIVKN